MTDNKLAAAMNAVAKRARDEAPTIPPAQVQPTRYEVSCLPKDHDELNHFTLQVEYRGRGLWAVTRNQQCLGRDGNWDWESIPSEREDDWLATHRFDLDTALTLAKQHAPLITVNGYTITDAIAMQAERDAR